MIQPLGVNHSILIICHFENTLYYFVLQIFALNAQGNQIFKESALLHKTPDKCQQHLHIILGVTLSVLLVALVALLIGILYFCRKEPVQRLQVPNTFIFYKL